MPPSLRIGVSPFGASRDEVLRLATAAVDAGIRTLWLGDGLLETTDFPLWSGGLESFTELAWLAGTLPTAALGCTAAVLPLRDPLWLAKQAASIDQLTEGRFTLVVAPGFWEREFAFRGLDFKRRGSLFEAGLDTLLGALAGDPTIANDRAGNGPGRVSPPPFFVGGLPVWLAGAHATLRRALTRGLPFQASRMTPAALEPWARQWHGGGGGKLAVRIRMQVGRQVPSGEAVDWQAVIGPASYLADQLHRYASLGVSDVSVVPGQDEHTSRATIDALGSIGPVSAS
jgi:alkanesulfonate monooxygenase SsuD/methylene tetrahydromethanopterin reductase-like flavin-dependent oxidoreductase (luciferase family)